MTFAIERNVVCDVTCTLSIMFPWLIQDRPDLAADFRVIESPDGTVQFESIVSPGVYITAPCSSSSSSGRASELQQTTARRHFIIRNTTK